MKRRAFVKTSVLGATISSIVPATNQAKLFKKSNQLLYELRVYNFKNAEQEKITEDYIDKAAIPALNRLGSKNIGVFKELSPATQTKLFVIVPFSSVEAFMQVNDKLLADAVYLQAGAAYLQATAAAPAYERIESSLLKAFKKFPGLVSPEKKARIFELRRYESATEMAGAKKIEMFNDKGEIDIFQKAGLTPVFFGETIIGAMRPNLTYMLTYDDMSAHDAHWKAFVNDPEWKKISAVPEYADARIVSKISSTFLVPAECSQV